jgi:hypothetical protein
MSLYPPMDCWRYLAEAVIVLDEKTPIEKRLKSIVRCNIAPQRHQAWDWWQFDHKPIGKVEWERGYRCLFCGEYFKGPNTQSKHAQSHKAHWLERMPHVVQIAWDRERGISGVPTNLEFRR